MRTNIIENETRQLIEKLRDFGFDPVEYLQDVVDQLEAETRLKRKRKRRQHEQA